MKKKLPIILLGVILACVLVFGFLYANNDIGKTANSLEADIRQSQKILDDWIVDGSISDTMAAFISYPQDKTDHTFSVYVNRPGLSFGYFFRGGGDIVEVDDYIAEFRFLYKGIIIKHNKTEPTYTKTSLFLCEKRRFLWPGLRKEGNLFKLAGPGGLAFFHLTKKEVSKWPMKK